MCETIRFRLSEWPSQPFKRIGVGKFLFKEAVVMRQLGNVLQNNALPNDLIELLNYCKW